MPERSKTIATDPNSRLIKALEDNTRALGAETKAIDALTREIRGRLPRRMTFTNHPYLEEEKADGGELGTVGEGEARVDSGE